MGFRGKPVRFNPWLFIPWTIPPWKTNMSPENQWLVQMYFLLKVRPFKKGTNSFVFGGLRSDLNSPPLPLTSQGHWRTVWQRRSSRHPTKGYPQKKQTGTVRLPCYPWVVFSERDPYLGGGNSNFFWNFHPKNWGRFPIWLAYFSDGLKPPTSYVMAYCNPYLIG